MFQELLLYDMVILLQINEITFEKSKNLERKFA